MRWSEVYDSDADEVQRLQNEVDALRAKVDEVRSIANGLAEYLKRRPVNPKSQALGVVCADLRKALGDPESEP